jgi:hypothetical protein
MEIPDIIE